MEDEILVDPIDATSDEKPYLPDDLFYDDMVYDESIVWDVVTFDDAPAGDDDVIFYTLGGPDDGAAVVDDGAIVVDDVPVDELPPVYADDGTILDPLIYATTAPEPVVEKGETIDDAPVFVDDGIRTLGGVIEPYFRGSEAPTFDILEATPHYKAVQLALLNEIA